MGARTIAGVFPYTVFVLIPVSGYFLPGTSRGKDRDISGILRESIWQIFPVPQGSVSLPLVFGCFPPGTGDYRVVTGGYRYAFVRCQPTQIQLCPGISTSLSASSYYGIAHPWVFYIGLVRQAQFGGAASIVYSETFLQVQGVKISRIILRVNLN